MTIRSDIETATIKSNAKTSKKKQKAAGMFGDMIDKMLKKSPGKKQKKKIDDILDQDPYAPKKPPTKEEEANMQQAGLVKSVKDTLKRRKAERRVNKMFDTPQGGERRSATRRRG